jgi:hypothetical protein
MHESNRQITAHEICRLGTRSFTALLGLTGVDYLAPGGIEHARKESTNYGTRNLSIGYNRHPIDLNGVDHLAPGGIEHA